MADAVPTSVQRFESDSLTGIGHDNVPVPKPLPCPRCPLSDLSPPTPVGVVTFVRAAGVVSHMSGRDLQPSDSVSPQRVAVPLPVNAVGERQIALVAAGIHLADGTHGRLSKLPTCRAREVVASVKAITFVTATRASNDPLLSHSGRPLRTDTPRVQTGAATTLAPKTTLAALPEGEGPGRKGGAEGTRTPDPHTARPT